MACHHGPQLGEWLYYANPTPENKTRQTQMHRSSNETKVGIPQGAVSSCTTVIKDLGKAASSVLAPHRGALLKQTL